MNSVEENEKKKLIGVRIFSDMPLQYYGGGEKIIIDISNYFYSKGVEIEVYQPNYKNESRMSTEEIRNVIKAEINTIKYATYHPEFLFQELPNINAFDKNRVNLVFLYRIPPKRYLKKLKTSKITVIFCMHGITTKIPLLSLKLAIFNLYSKFALSYFIKFLNERSIIKAQVLTKTTEKYLELRGADKNHVVRIPNCIEFNDFAVGKNNTQFEVIFMGRIINIQKGIKRLVSIIKKLPSEIKILIIGSGRDKKILERIQLKNVKYLGFVNEKLKKEILTNGNLLILTSNTEPFGLVILEGLASGLPIVSTPVEGSMEILNTDKNLGTISSFNSEYFAKDIIRYFKKWKDDKDLYFQNKIKRREIAMKSYDRSAMMEEYYEMINL